MIYNGREIWGPKAWHLLHAFSINNNYKISNDKIHNYYIFYTTFLYILPCLICSEHYSDILYNLHPIEEDKINRIYLKRWVYEIHNIINNLLNKEIFPYNIFIENYNTINHKDIFYIIDAIYKNFDYNLLSLYKYDQIYNFFINFCLLYPDKKIKKNLLKITKKKDFLKIKTPKQFEYWYRKNSFILKIICC
jgi:hypothetical protein